jgi:hypothetical protein
LLVVVVVEMVLVANMKLVAVVLVDFYLEQ